MKQDNIETPEFRYIDRPEDNETRLIDIMKDIDLMYEISKELYPNHNWTRIEFMSLFHYDLMLDKLESLISRDED